LWKQDILRTHFFLKQQQQGGMSLTYSGHNALKCGRPARIGQQILLDTGAGYLDPKEPYYLSMIETRKQVVYQMSGKGKLRIKSVKFIA
jgi:hypothetical protein